jgi:hypothetical protein
MDFNALDKWVIEVVKEDSGDKYFHTEGILNMCLMDS